MCCQRDCKKHDQFIRNCGRAFGTPLRTTYLFPFQIRMGDQGYYDQKFGLTPACIEDVLLAERGTEPSELIPASSLSAMIWGGRGWHVILRAVRYTAAVAWMA